MDLETTNLVQEWSFIQFKDFLYKAYLVLPDSFLQSETVPLLQGPRLRKRYVLCIYSKKEATMSSAPIQMDVYTHTHAHTQTCTDTSLDTHTNTYAFVGSHARTLHECTYS